MDKNHLALKNTVQKARGKDVAAGTRAVES